jgi:hypothetical protein
MNTLPAEDERHIGRFLKLMRFRYHKSATVYRCVLRDFLANVRTRKGGTRGVSKKTLRVWLQARSEQSVSAPGSALLR